MSKSIIKLALVFSVMPITYGFASDLPSKKITPVAPNVVNNTWTGFYVGLNGGYGFSSSSKATFDGSSHNFNGANGFLAGAQIGYDHQIDKMVLGAAIDFNYSDVNKTWLNTADSYSIKLNQSYAGTARARIGYLVSNDILLYITGGAAMSKIKGVGTDMSVTPNVVNKQSQTHYGFVVGGGAEYRVTKNVSTFVEYRYSDYQAKNYSRFATKADFSNSEIRIGLNYRFWLNKKIMRHRDVTHICYQFYNISQLGVTHIKRLIWEVSLYWIYSDIGG